MTCKRKNFIIDGNIPRRKIKPLTEGQHELVKCIQESTVSFITGKSGSGKSFLSVYEGLQLLLSKRIEKFVISRPVVECGEKLGSLPGTEQEKVHPYLRPILDILLEFLTKEELDGCLNSGKIDISPLAYSRGLTFKNCYALLTEAQNCSLKQLKMWLTRIGEGCKMVIEGDAEQSDINEKVNPLQHCVNRLKNIDGISIVELGTSDIVRHPLIKIILEKI